MPLSRPEGRPETALVRRVFIGLLVANLAVVAAKSFVGLRAGSLAILGSALDSSVDAVIAWYENRRGRELRSELLIADAAHTRADVLITVGVLAGVLFARQGWWWIDPVVAIAVALVIVQVAYRILVRTVPVLVDQRAL